MIHYRFPPAIEPLEARIAPALAVLNPLADLTIGPGKTGVDIDLSRMFDPTITDNGHTIVTLHTNFDSDPLTTGIQGDIVIEMFDDAAPLSVQNFLTYVTSTDPKTNYANTFFHRSVSGFVVQGGGFDAADPGTHIPTPFDVHNEFDRVNRSNVAGTIAMAKTGLGPNTATSEWFFNLANNSSNLDNQNGGFTVFAKVIQGMDVVNGIAAVAKFNFSGTNSIGNINSAFTDIPLQNYNADPDSNPNTPAPAPTADNYVRLTGFDIQAPPSGTVSGVTYSVNPSVDIVDATTGLASDLVTATVVGSNLRLNFKTHAAGTVRVTVHGTDTDSTSAEDTFVVNLQPNLVASFEQDPFDGIIIGGDAKSSNIVIGNNGGGWAVGNVNVKVYLSKVDGSAGPDVSGVLVEPGRDFLIGNFANQPVDVAGGGTVTLTKNLQIPMQLVTASGQKYRVLVEVTPSDSGIKERFADDNVSFDGEEHLWENGFGTFTRGQFGTRTDAKLVYQETDGDMVQLSITTSGSGQVNFDGTLADFVIGTARPASVFTAEIISGAGVGEHDIDVHNVEMLQYLRAVSMPLANVSGELSATEGFLGLRMGDFTGGGLISIGRLPARFTVNPTLIFHSVSDVSIESLARIRAIHAAEWVETDGIPNHINAASIGSIVIGGDLEADIAIATSRPLVRFHVGGFFKDATFTTKGDVGTVNVGGLDHANIFIGTKSRPNDAGDFAQVLSLGSLTVRGVPGAPRSFIASNVAADHIGAISVTGIDRIDSPAAFGIVADAVRSYNRAGGPSSGPLSAPQRFDGGGRYSLTIV